MDSTIPEAKSDTTPPREQKESVSTDPHENSANGAPTTPAKRSFQVEDLFSNSFGEAPALGMPSTLPQSSYEEVRIMYLHEYGRGLDLFLETNWYTGKGWDHLIQDVKTFELFRAMLDAFARTKVNDYENFLKLPQIEARVTWALVCMPRVVHGRVVSEGANTATIEPELEKVLRRLAVFEHLVTNKYSRENLTPLSSHIPSTDPSLNRQAEFWHELGQMITLHDASTESAWSSLRRMRQLSNQQENRDVLYSMAVVRCTGLAAKSFSVPSDALAVAKKFIEDEASSKGTNQVIQRLCGIAVRSWSALR